MADYTTSPVFSSPAYWIALGVGVVGIGAAAMQERKGSGSAARVRGTRHYSLTDVLSVPFLTWVTTGHASPEVLDMLADMDVSPKMSKTARFALLDDHMDEIYNPPT